MARLDKACASITGGPDPCAVATTDSSAPAGPTESTDARLRHHAPTTILQPTTATPATNASAANTADAQLPSILAAHTPPEQNAPCATPTQPFEPSNPNTPSANATHAAHAKSGAATRYATVACAVPTRSPCSGWRGSRWWFTKARWTSKASCDRSQAVPISTASMGDTRRELREPECERDGHQSQFVRC